MVHKNLFPGRAYISQIDDPSYKICQELTRILTPIDEKGDAFIRDMYHFKELVNNLKGPGGRFLDIVGIFLNVLLKKMLEVVREELDNGDTLHLFQNLGRENLFPERWSAHWKIDIQTTGEYIYALV